MGLCFKGEGVLRSIGLLIRGSAPGVLWSLFVFCRVLSAMRVVPAMVIGLSIRGPDLA